MFLLQNMKVNFCMQASTKLAFAGSSTIFVPQNFKNSLKYWLLNGIFKIFLICGSFSRQSSTKHICTTITFKFRNVESTQDSLITLVHSCSSYRNQSFNLTNWFLNELQAYRKYETKQEHSSVNYSKWILFIDDKMMVETFSQAFKLYTLTGIP